MTERRGVGEGMGEKRSGTEWVEENALEGVKKGIDKSLKR